MNIIPHDRPIKFTDLLLAISNALAGIKLPNHRKEVREGYLSLIANVEHFKATRALNS